MLRKGPLVRRKCPSHSRIKYKLVAFKFLSSFFSVRLEKRMKEKKKEREKEEEEQKERMKKHKRQ